ncbi:RING-H2 finger protein ATL39-like [Lolium rigidum]|uniref:RING-H2 finger protein ATL39-like n=1 Tax=Lolium rigidum TaxID=89674 RepID=UPI001F5DDBB8|nr:RING-H2 finger protein ATL39-like [Lolium rigidum]
MSTAQSPATAVAAAVEKTKHWAPHGPALTACLVSINLLMILLIFFYFWRFFSGKRGSLSPGGGNDEEASSSADSSPANSPRGSRRLTDPDQLPVSVYDSSSDDPAGGKAECAVCIVEFRDGDLARLLPRCGHRFHAACVDAWLRLHSTCPLCRADVVAPPPAAAEPKNGDPKDDGGEQCPV